MGEGWSLEPADKILISGTFCWHQGCSSTARTKRKATLSEIGHTVCFGFDSLHLFAITIPFCSRKKLFLERVILLYSPSRVLGSPWAVPRPAAAVAKAPWWAHCGKGRNRFQNKAQHWRRVKCSHAAACVVACGDGELWGVLFFFFLLFFFKVF